MASGAIRINLFDLVVAIGPPVMMKAVSRVTEPYGVKTLVSLNAIMIDGTGMCGGCRVRLASGMKFACVDGPDFDGHEVDFDDLLEQLRSEHHRLAPLCRHPNPSKEVTR